MPINDFLDDRIVKQTARCLESMTKMCYRFARTDCPWQEEAKDYICAYEYALSIRTATEDLRDYFEFFADLMIRHSKSSAKPVFDFLTGAGVMALMAGAVMSSRILTVAGAATTVITYKLEQYANNMASRQAYEMLREIRGADPLAWNKALQQISEKYD